MFGAPALLLQPLEVQRGLLHLAWDHDEALGRQPGRGRGPPPLRGPRWPAVWSVPGGPRERAAGPEPSAVPSEAFRDRQDALDVVGTLSRGVGLSAAGDDVLADELVQRLAADTVVEYEAAVLGPRATALRMYHAGLWTAFETSEANSDGSISSGGGGGGGGGSGPTDRGAGGGAGPWLPAVEACAADRGMGALSMAGALSVANLRALALTAPSLCAATLLQLDAGLAGRSEQAWLAGVRCGAWGAFPGGGVSTGLLAALCEHLWGLVCDAGTAGPLVLTAAATLFNVLMGLGRTADALLLAHTLLEAGQGGGGKGALLASLPAHPRGPVRGGGNSNSNSSSGSSSSSSGAPGPEDKGADGDVRPGGRPGGDCLGDACGPAVPVRCVAAQGQAPPPHPH
jgi:hypothetical protein